LHLVGEGGHIGAKHCSSRAGGVASIPDNSDTHNVPFPRHWRFEMKLSLPFFILHQPVCLGFKNKDGVTLHNYMPPMFMATSCCILNASWPLNCWFDTTFGLSNKAFKLMGFAIDSRRRNATVCLVVIDKESVLAYEHMYTPMDGEFVAAEFRA
jgi:hypothetical protein